MSDLAQFPGVSLSVLLGFPGLASRAPDEPRKDAQMSDATAQFLSPVSNGIQPLDLFPRANPKPGESVDQPAGDSTEIRFPGWFLMSVQCPIMAIKIVPSHGMLSICRTCWGLIP